VTESYLNILISIKVIKIYGLSYICKLLQVNRVVVTQHTITFFFYGILHNEPHSTGTFFRYIKTMPLNTNVDSFG